MQLKVRELPEHLTKRAEGTLTAPLSDFQVTDDATCLTVHDRSFPLDQIASRSLTRYLKVPDAYYEKLTPEFRATVLRYEFDRREDTEAVLESLDDTILAVHQPSQVMLPLSRVAQVVTKVLDPEDSIRRLITDGERFHLDATSGSHRVEFPAPGDSHVGDITEAGFRVLAYPFQMKPPSVGVYAERLVCSNGMTTEEQLGRIALKGRTVEEVIDSMEEAAGLVLSQLDSYLDKLSETRNMPVPGSPAAFVARLAQEARVSRQVLDRVLEIVNQMDNPSVWDVQNAFTAVANSATQYSTMVRLQTLGGSLSFSAEQMINRCGQCERLL